MRGLKYFELHGQLHITCVLPLDTLTPVAFADQQDLTSVNHSAIRESISNMYIYIYVYVMRAYIYTGVYVTVSSGLLPTKGECVVMVAGHLLIHPCPHPEFGFASCELL